MSDRKHFAWKLLAGSLLPVVLLLVIQRILEANHLAPRSLMVYVPYILVFTVIIYLTIYRRILKNARTKKGERLYVHLFLILTLIWPASSFIYLYRDFSQSIEEYGPDKTTPEINSSFVHFNHIDPQFDSAQDAVYYRRIRSRTNPKYQFQYFLLVPFTYGPVDSTKSNWIHFRVYESAPVLNEGQEKETAMNDFGHKCYEQFKQYDFSKVVYYRNDLEQRLDKGWNMLRKRNLLTDNSVILEPSTESLNGDRNTTLVVLLIVYALVFCGTCLFYYSD